MDPRWKDVAESGDLDGLYSLIGEEALFADTPLHVAAKAGNTHVALEIANFNPSLARKLNQSGFSPLHLSVAGGHELLAIGLVEMDSELVLFKGREGRTPVHEAAISGNTGLLRKFLSACPRAFEALTFKRETALHLAVKHNQLEAFKFMMQWLRLNDKEHVLEWKDDNGDTILHMAAASTNHHEASFLIISTISLVQVIMVVRYINFGVYQLVLYRQHEICRTVKKGAKIRPIPTPSFTFIWVDKRDGC